VERPRAAETSGLREGASEAAVQAREAVFWLLARVSFEAGGRGTAGVNPSLVWMCDVMEWMADGTDDNGVSVSVRVRVNPY